MGLGEKAINILKDAGSIIAVISAIVGGLAIIITNSAKFKSWIKTKREHSEALDKLAINVDILEEIPIIKKQMEIMANDINTIKVDTVKINNDLVNKTLKDDTQDKQIRRSTEESMLHSEALSAILDWAIKNGANGSAHKSRDNINDFMRKNSHNFD